LQLDARLVVFSRFPKDGWERDPADAPNAQGEPMVREVLGEKRRHPGVVSRRRFLEASCGLAAIGVAHPPSLFHVLAEPAMNEIGRFNGTVAIWYTSHFQIVSRDWDSIEEYKGPYHPLLGSYRYKDKSDLLKHLKWLRRAGVDMIVYDIYGFAEWGPLDIEKDRVLQWLLEALAEQERESRKLQLLIWLEKYDSNPTLEEYRFALQYVRNHFAPKPFYFRWNNKPMVLIYVNHMNPLLNQLEKEAGDFTLQPIRAYDGKEYWSYCNEWPQPENREWMPVSPGIDSFLERAYLARKKGEPRLHASEWKRFDRQNGEYFRKQFQAARRVNPKFIFISGWNDWQYGLQIEPAIEYRFQYVDLAAQMLGREDETEPYRDEK
jgi:hypothetical protein